MRLILLQFLKVSSLLQELTSYKRW